MAVRYKNKKTGKIATYSNPMPRLERNKKKWERVEGAKQDKPADKPSG